MGKKYVIDEKALTAIADVIRSERGTTDKIPASELVNEITAALSTYKSFIEGGVADLVIPCGVTKLVEQAFCHRTDIKSITIPNTVKRIGGACFERGRGLTRIVIPDSVTDMDHYVFYGHYTVEDVVIGNGVPAIGYQAFYECPSLKSITFGKGLQTIWSCAFQNSSECLTYDFTKCESVPALLNTNAFEGINADTQILVPPELYSSWVYATNWSTYFWHIVDYYSADLGDTSGEIRYALHDLNILTNDYHYLPSGSGEPKAYYSYDGGLTATEITSASSINASDITFHSFYDEGSSNVWDWYLEGSYIYFWGNDLDIWVEANGKTVYKRHFESAVE